MTRPPGGVILLLVIDMSKSFENSHKVKCRTDEEKKYLNTRLKTIEGQVRGIRDMIDNDRYCKDVLIQISAVTNSLKSLGNDVLKSHLSTCVIDEIKRDNLDIVDEIMDLIKRRD